MPDEPSFGIPRNIAVAAVVLTVSVPGVPGDAVPEQVGPSETAGDTVQLTRFTLPVKPLLDVTVTVEVAEPPGLTEDGDNVVAVSVKDWLGVCPYFTTKASLPPAFAAWKKPVVNGKSVAEVVVPVT